MGGDPYAGGRLSRAPPRLPFARAARVLQSTGRAVVLQDTASFMPFVYGVLHTQYLNRSSSERRTQHHHASIGIIGFMLSCSNIMIS